MQNDTKTAMYFGIAIVALLLGGTLMTHRQASRTGNASPIAATQEGVQVITIAAKGGYTPERVEAKAGVPTELRITTNGTYDCSSVVVIPQLGFEKTLPATGTEKIAISAEQATGTLQGQCGMAMYTFQIAFK
jgi:plastocyanin domain-containing protein